MEHFENLVLSRLHDTIDDDNEIINNTIYIKNKQMTIIPYIAGLNDGKSFSTATIYFTVKSKIFDTDFFESATGVGSNKNEAITQSVGNFLLCAFCGIRKLYNKEYKDSLKSDFFGVHKNWNVSISCALFLGIKTQEMEDQNFWDIIKLELAKRLGNRKVYWIKIYGAKQVDNSVIGEVRINDMVDTALGKLIEEEVRNWTKGKSFESKKQFIMLSQEETTFIKYPYTKDEIKSFTISAIEMFLQSKTELDYDNIVPKLYDIIGDLSLTTELHRFIPEICAKQYFSNANFSDKIMIEKDGNIVCEIFKTQSIGYETILKVIQEIFNEKIFGDKEYEVLVSFSSIYSAVLQMKDKKINLKDAYISIRIAVPKNYFVR